MPAPAIMITQVLADQLGVDAKSVLICSTGVIGVPIPVATLLAGLAPLVEALDDAGGDAGQRHPHYRSGGQAGGAGTGAGGAPGAHWRHGQGSGMIHPTWPRCSAFQLRCPSMPVSGRGWQRAVQRSFNAITVDGDTNTNDTVLACGRPTAGPRTPCRSGTGPYPGHAAAGALPGTAKGPPVGAGGGAVGEAAALQVAHGLWFVPGGQSMAGIELGADRGGRGSLWCPLIRMRFLGLGPIN